MITTGTESNFDTSCGAKEKETVGKFENDEIC